VASIGPPEGSGGDAVPVDPLALRGVTRPPEELQDLTTGGLVTVGLGRVAEPADKNRARDGVGLQGPNRTAVVAVDGVTHRVVIVVASVGGLGSVAVADVPDAVLSTVGVGVTGFDCLEALLTGIEVPSIHRGGAVAGIPDQVGGFEGHGVCVHVAIIRPPEEDLGGSVDSLPTVISRSGSPPSLPHTPHRLRNDPRSEREPYGRSWLR
jgi:hypothetical protein